MEEIDLAENYYEKINIDNLKYEFINSNDLSKIKNNCIFSPFEIDADEYLDIAFAFDQNLLKQFEVTLNSILKNTKVLLESIFKEGG